MDLMEIVLILDLVNIFFVRFIKLCFDFIKRLLLYNIDYVLGFFFSIEY